MTTSPSFPPNASPGAQETPPEPSRSKGFVVFFVGLILFGPFAWNAWDYFGTEGLNPKEVKSMASAYERECYEIHQDAKTCKRHIGTWHRRCLPKGVDRSKPGEEPRPIRYVPDAYSACMRAKRIQELGK